jgi:hypothetical protein
MKKILCSALFVLLVCSSGAWAADAKVSALTELNAAPAEADELYINDGGVSKKITVLNLMKSLQSALTGYAIHRDNLPVTVAPSACSVITPAAAATLTVGLSNCYTYLATDNEDATITASGAGTAGDEITIIFTTAGASDEIITFHATLMASTGTLTLAVTAARFYVIRFISNGSRWFEVSRTAIQT